MYLKKKAILYWITVVIFGTKLCFTLHSVQSTTYLEQSNSWAENTLKKFSLREKIGQLFVVAAASNFDQPNEMLASALTNCPYNMEPEHIETLIQNYNVGGVIFLFKSDPATQHSFIERYQQKADIPLLITQDCEWGLSMRLDTDPTKVVRYPRNLTLGALQDEHLVYQMGHEVGKECTAVGVHMNFAPVVDVNNNPNNPVIHDRSFGDDPERVARLAALFAQGLQDAGVMACAKHFPGHGDTDVDSHLDLPVIAHDYQRLNTIELLPFKKLIAQGIGGIMNAHLAVPALENNPQLPSSLSHSIVTQELQHKLCFQGLVVTDGLGMEAITKHFQPGQLELQSFLAGNDILLCPLDVPHAIELIEHAIKEGKVTEDDLNRRVLKILKAKEWAFAQQAVQKNKRTESTDSFLVRPEAYALQKTLFSNAITLVHNTSNVTFTQPGLEKNHVIQIGRLPDNVLQKTLEQQNCKVSQFSASFSDEELSSCLQETQNTDSLVIAIGQMNKFAQKQYGIASNTMSLIDTLKNMGKTVTVIVFGTPYSVRYFKNVDALFVAYEDAQPAQEAMVDVLRGTMEAQGHLPVQVN